MATGTVAALALAAILSIILLLSVIRIASKVSEIAADVNAIRRELEKKKDK